MNKSVFQLITHHDDSLPGLPTGAVKTAAERLGKEIVRGVYAEAETLPHELELAEELSVSRTVLREAIKVLSAKSLVRTARRYGTRVTPRHEWQLLDPDVIRWHDPDSPLSREIFIASAQLRSIIEPEAAALAAQHATNTQLRIIAHAAQHITADPHGREAMIAADCMFHETILEATNNILLSQFKCLVRNLIRLSYPTTRKHKEIDREARKLHLATAAEIVTRNPEGARQKMAAMFELHHHFAIHQDADAQSDG